jgi:hypothetical protein
LIVATKPDRLSKNELKDKYLRFARIEGIGGAEGDRTPDLMNAIHALSQLSYGPVIFWPTHLA